VTCFRTRPSIRTPAAAAICSTTWSNPRSANRSSATSVMRARRRRRKAWNRGHCGGAIATSNSVAAGHQMALVVDKVTGRHSGI
jgi:hypothetical protein